MKQTILMLLVMMAVNKGLMAQQEAIMTTTTFFQNPNPVLLKTVPFGDPGTDKDYDFYMKRSKNQRIVGWSTLGAGLLFSGIGILVASSSNNDYYNDTNENTAGILLLLGAVSGIVSIPFMISATVNKHKAKLILDNQKTGFGVPSHVGKNIPGVTLVIPFGK